ncbi:hypothetical protein [Streptomyces sp. NPDC002044]|uniref:hypothetical protein n=1 Tax=Streptomyces sp. NPDC002044 TaxID=3154662 RepID=UPI003327D2E0
MAGGQVERAGHLGPPVEDKGGSVRVVRADSDPADVRIAAVGELQTAETQTVLPGIESGKQPRLFGDQDIPFQAGLESGADLPQGPCDRTFGLVTKIVEAPIEIGDESLLFPEFLG